jgi:hypothetical protein
MSVRYYHRVGAKSGVSVGPLGLLILLPIVAMFYVVATVAIIVGVVAIVIFKCVVGFVHYCKQTEWKSK